MALGNLIGEVLDGKYRIEKQLGEGGMGAVYLAMHLGTERPVALKVIAPQFMKHDEFVERFRREARAAGRLRHPNVVDVTDFGFARVGAEQVAYLVMEYLDGCTLDEILSEETRLPLSWVVDILEQTCSAVEEAHQQGIVHRDLKPDNIWLEPNRRGGYTIKVLDFGIAKLDEPARQVAALVSAPEESAPPPTLLSDLSKEELSEAKTLLPPAIQAEPPPTVQAELSEVATQVHTPPVATTDLSEAGTQILSTEIDDDGSEAGTRMMPADSLAEDRTRILEHHTTDKQLGLQTSSGGSLTRVGSILGTPLYMSPEQCRGEALDARSDIYSLGVIAYRLLSGQTPFSGDFQSVMQMHRETAPPPLVVKRVPKKVAALVMSALAKKPEERPQTAAAFASTLRAQSTGVGVLLRHALTLYTEHLPTFLRLALLVYAPVVLTTFLQVTINYLSDRQTIPSPWGGVVGGLTSVFNIVAMFFAVSVVVGVTTWLVTQLLALPLKPMRLRPAFGALRKRLKPFFLTTTLTNFLVFIGITVGLILSIIICLLLAKLLVSIGTMLGFAPRAVVLAVPISIGIILGLGPGFLLMMIFALVAPTLMMEDLSGRAALRRSYQLFKRSKLTVAAIVSLHFLVPALLSITIALLIAAIVKALNVPVGKQFVSIVSMLHQMISLPVTLLLSSLTSIVTALLYWKTRMAGGETLRQAFGQFAEEEAPASHWQQKMRTRMQTPTRTTR